MDTPERTDDRVPTLPDPSVAARPARAGVGRSLPVAVLVAVRPRQWVKNLLVLAAPLAAGQVINPEIVPPILAALVLFCAAASGVYLLNDVRDLDQDRRHPVKRWRPIAAGDLPPRLALSLSAVLLLVAIVGGFAVTPALGAVLVVYVAVQACYAFWLKQEPVLDLACVASGFLLRAIAGGAATGIALSEWFLLVAAFGSLFMVAGKRYSEIRTIGSEAGTRLSLQVYSATYLRFVWTLAAGVTVTAYSLWALHSQRAGELPLQSISIVPFVLALLRYALDIDRGVADAPEDIVLGDRVLQGLGAIWFLLVVIGVWQA